MKKLLFLLLAFMATVAVNAEQVSRQQALQKAKQFMPGKQFGEAKSFARAGSPTDQEPFYIFNAEGNLGYVIVSGDDRTTEILGYSKTGNLDLEQIPDNLKSWLDGYARQMEALGTSVTPAQKAKTRGADNWGAISPLIQTKWNQYYPYNMMCPDRSGKDWLDAGFDTEHLIKDNPTYHCVTGCVATAMAQVMYYHKHPDNCPALSEYNTKSYDWTMKALEATTFKWEKMKETYNGNETDESAEAVAELMRYCGQAVNMNYRLEKYGGSLASVSAGVMAEVFGYSKNIRDLYRDPYTTSQWEEMIYAELVANRPVLYSGQSESGGHEFIVDGYDGYGLFHMNWGWGGMSDGYFVLSLADPDNQGAGGSATNGAFQFDQSALFGVEPGSTEEVMMPKVVSNVDPMVTKEYERANADEDFTNVQFEGAVYFHLNTPSTTDQKIYLGWALCQNGQIKQAIPSCEYTLLAGQTYSSSGTYTDTEANLGAGLESGKYEVYQVFKLTEDGAWSLCTPYWNPAPYTNYRTAFLVADVTETTLTVRQTVPSFKVNTITTTEFPSTGSPLDVTLNVTNDGETYEQQVKLWSQKEGETAWTCVATATRRIDPGKSDDINMSYTPTVEGSYTLKVTNADSDDALKTTTVTVYASINATVGNLKFICNSGTKKARLVGHTYSSGTTIEVDIPATIDVGEKYTVTEISDGAFERFGYISAVTIPSTVKIIGDDAFYNCYSLSEVTVPEGVEHIGKYAFQACFDLNRVSLPSTLKSIGDNAFYKCPLSTVAVAMASPLTIARNVFMTTKKVDEETVEVFTSADLYVPIGLKTVYSAADVWKEFPTTYQGELKDVTLEGITYTYITGEDFAIVKSGNGDVLQNTDVVIPSTIPVEGKTYKVKKIADRAFLKISMNSLTIQPGLEEIGNSAFWNVNGVKEFDIPAGVKHIGEKAFQYCFSAKTVKLPASLTNIDDYAFGNMTSLTSVVSYIPIPVVISSNVFGVLSGSTITAPTATLTVPYNAKSQYEAAEGWRDFPNTVEMEPSGLGDANNDDIVDANDIKTIADYIMGKNPSPFVFANANINGDSKVDVADLVLLVNMVKALQAK